jgi:hypothetical protein
VRGVHRCNGSASRGARLDPSGSWPRPDSVDPWFALPTSDPREHSPKRHC